MIQVMVTLEVVMGTTGKVTTGIIMVIMGILGTMATPAMGTTEGATEIVAVTATLAGTPVVVAIMGTARVQVEMLQ
jgi:hypothetical protein